MGWRSRRGRGYQEYDSYWPKYVPVAERRANAVRQLGKLAKKGQALSPVVIAGRKITTTFWGKAWSDNLESYSDYSNRLPRGASYVRNGLVVDLQIAPGRITALVQGSALYTVEIEIASAKAPAWKALVAECAGQIDSLVELLSGKLSSGVMQLLSRPKNGLLPSPTEIELDCSCPDYATMCKHVAAVMYGVGARLDEKPELLFELRKVDHADLVAAAGAGVTLNQAAAGHAVLESADLGSLFGIEMESEDREPVEIKTAPAPAPAPVKVRRPGPKPAPARATAPERKRKTPPARVPEPRKWYVATAVLTVTNSRSEALLRLLGSGRKRSSIAPRLSARDLVDAGISRSTIQSWLVSGVLERTADRGVYRTTSRTRECIERLSR